ncbi:hypothetical protein HCA69_02085 [Listeria grandensis]|uniref:Uncharacterized protein n=1 Tax=Listeria grandensis TaxID=1494963 RepID=A0A7X1CNN6_9LIST|nr:hypothetical protein [Listeria grandensis]MBC1935138.1 hypothetical protein [Listeria grandensis]
MELERICRLLKQRGEQVIVRKNSVETYHELDEDYYRLERERLKNSEQWHYFYVRSKKEKVVGKEHLASFSDEREGARIFYLWVIIGRNISGKSMNICAIQIMILVQMLRLPSER